MATLSHSIPTIKTALRAAEKERATLQAALDAATAATAKANERARAKRKPVGIVFGSRCDLLTTGSVSCYDLAHAKDAKARKAILDEVRAGTIKVTVSSGFGGGNAALARNVAKRMYDPQPATLRRIKHLDAVIKRAQEERRTLIADIPDTGLGWTLDTLIDDLASRASADRARMEAGEAERAISWGNYGPERQRTLSDAERDVTRLTAHLAWLEDGKQGECPCGTCRAERDNARWAAERKEREAAYAKEVKERERHAKHAGFHAGCKRCEDVAHAGDRPAHAKRPNRACSRCAAELRFVEQRKDEQAVLARLAVQ